MTVQIPIRIPARDVERLDAAVAAGHFASRSEALRHGLRLVLQQERDRELEEEYRRGYSEFPQEEWVGQLGLSLFAAWVAAEERGQEPL